ncbi:magnesium transporter [Citricoccus sp. NR2]|uniref:magnesium transporter n=1 Tax=Citricoccus sp. NR2 TaxID=3004095 RepID=UPI0022DE1AB7|nr:magnesium transporter [Citricoccus sp. NR2]WBL19063.1 magnesium transporter [Citricoccus sp. NR2]
MTMSSGDDPTVQPAGEPAEQPTVSLHTGALPSLDSQELGVREALRKGDWSRAGALLREFSAPHVERFLDRTDPKDVPVVFRLLDKDVAVDVFAAIEPRQQRDLIEGLQDDDVQELFGQLQASGQARLLDEMPAEVAQQLLASLPGSQRDSAGTVLGYPAGSVGRRMRPVLIELRSEWTVAEALDAIREADIPERRQRFIARLPVVAHAHQLQGMIELSRLVTADQGATIESLMDADVLAVLATEDDETAARLCAEHDLLALPVTDETHRIVGLLTVDQAFDILEEEESEDSQRAGGSTPLAQPYLSTPVKRLFRARIVWLLVLAIGAILTVQVLEVFEETLETMVVLSLFVPLLIGTGGNTGNQAATTVTRALALGDVRPRDVVRVLRRELLVGLSLGATLGSLGLLVAGLVYSWSLGAVIGSTLLAVCTLAASVGSLMPLLAKKIGVDPAVFSNPFISTVVDALGLIVYFLIARLILGI